MITIEITGRIPSKKNSKIMVCMGKRPVLLPSKKYQEWQKEKSWEMKAQRVKSIEEVNSIVITFYAPDKRKTDLSNKAESIMDLLVDNDIIEDDNWFVVPELVLRFQEVDKENPRAIVDIC